MKSLLLITLITLTSSSFAACEMNLYQKKAGAKSFYTTNGERLSLSAVSKIKNVCNIKVTLASEAMKKALKVKRLQAQLKKLQTK